MITVFARYGFTFKRKTVGSEGAHHVIDDIRDLLTIVDTANGLKRDEE
jgi:phosphoglycolate phosphatase-like HAD superfamily hydrolase